MPFDRKVLMVQMNFRIDFLLHEMFKIHRIQTCGDWEWWSWWLVDENLKVV